MRGWLGRGAPWLLVLGAMPAAAQVRQSCTIDQTAPSEADQAFAGGEFKRAHELYAAAVKAHPDEVTSTAGLIRAELAEGRLEEAKTGARDAAAAHPTSALLADALGEVELRRGEPEDAARAFDAAMKQDPCVAQIHLDFAQYLELVAMHATARKQLELAHRLAPKNPVIEAAWRAATIPPPTATEELARLERELAQPDLKPERRTELSAAIRLREASARGSCEPVGEVKPVKMAMVAVTNGPTEEVRSRALDVELNGHKRLLEIDTGASGLLITRAAALSAGLVPEAEVKTHGIGDEGGTSGFVSHVDNIRIGGMEFRNCMVRVLDKKDVLSVSGLIGTDVFQNYLVTLDMPARELRLSALPERPGEAKTDEALKPEGGPAKPAEASAEERVRDRFIAPEMKEWTRIYRLGHDLIVPTKIGATPTKLFILDTGDQVPLISLAAAREVTGVYGSDMDDLRGLSGRVKKTAEASTVNMQFAGVQQRVNGMVTVDTGDISRDLGVEIAGFLAFPTLNELLIQIDYRDNLLRVVYDPTQGYHRH